MATPISGDKIEVGEGMDYTNKYAQSFSDENFGRNVTGVNKLYSDGSLPKGYLTKGDVVLNVKGEAVRGTTLYLGTGKGSNVYLYKAAFTLSHSSINTILISQDNKSLASVKNYCCRFMEINYFLVYS
mgnify:CR=1 FL=1